MQADSPRARRRVAWLFLVGCLGAAAAPAQTSFLPMVIAWLRAGGAEKFILGEEHLSFWNPPHHLQVLDGLRQAGPFCLWAEANQQPGTREHEAMGEAVDILQSESHRMRRAAAIDLVVALPICGVPWPVAAPRHPALDRFMFTRDFSAEWINFRDPARHDLQRFLDARGVHVARVGYMHATWQCEPHLQRMEASYAPVDAPLLWELGSFHDPAVFDAYRQAVEKGPAVFVARTEAWGLPGEPMPAAERPWRAYQHYVDEGGAVLEFPFHVEATVLLNTSIVVPCELRAVLERCEQRIRRAGVPVTLHHDPGKPCHRRLPGQRRGEL